MRIKSSATYIYNFITLMLCPKTKKEISMLGITLSGRLDFLGGGVFLSDTNGLCHSGGTLGISKL